LLEALSGVFAVAESYPQLKADEQFQRLMHELVITEDRIQAARRFYNANVRDYNTRCQTFPSNMIAGWGGFHEEEFFEISDAHERSVPVVNLQETS
jgi:LemA protein